MGRLHDLGLKYGTDKATFHQYLDFYQEHLPESIDRLLEIGVMHGDSLRMWRDYYPGAQIIGVDIDLSRFWGYAPGLSLYQGDATDWDFLDRVWQDAGGQFDVVVDDGSHMTDDQQQTFTYAFTYMLKPGGIYIMEDLHTSRMKSYVNSAETTEEWLRRRDWDGELDVRWFSRGPANLPDSVTAIIRKPEERR